MRRRAQKNKQKSKSAVILLGVCVVVLGSIAALAGVKMVTEGQEETLRASLSFFFEDEAIPAAEKIPEGEDEAIRVTEETPEDETALVTEETPEDEATLVTEETPEDDAALITEETPVDEAAPDEEETPEEAAPPAPPKIIRPSRMNFEPIKKELPETAAWIKLGGTKIDYPVMYRDDDNEYYLTRLPNGKKSSSGSIYIDYRNSPDFSDPNTMVYGHRMKSGAMFGALRYYNNQSFYDQHSVVSIFTPDGDYEVVLFAGYAFDQTVETPPLSFSDEEEFDNFVQTARKRSAFKSDIEVKFGDRLVTLCTCEYSFEEGRLVVIGKLIEK